MTGVATRASTQATACMYFAVLEFTTPEAPLWTHLVVGVGILCSVYLAVEPCAVLALSALLLRDPDRRAGLGDAGLPTKIVPLAELMITDIGFAKIMEVVEK